MDAKVTDQESPGRKQIERFSVAGGLAANKSDQATRGVEFLLLKNCLIDKRLNAVLKRPGSLTETIASSLGLPLGAGEYLTSSNGGAIPISLASLVNFGGSRFFSKQANTWSEVTVDASTDFATSRLNSFSMLGDNLFIAGGLPAKWGGPGKSIQRMGIAAPAAAPTIISSTVAGSLTLVDGTRYVYTYYDSLTGLESDWSEPSALVGPITNNDVLVGIPTETAINSDQIRLYRYLDGGGVPYLITTLAHGTTQYLDSTPDALLTAKAAPRYEKSLPPSQSYITAAFAQCIWLVDGTDPFKLVFSKPYTGSSSDLELFPIDNYVRTNFPITGLLVTPGKLLVFHPRGISYISGGNADDFTIQPFVAGVGTLFNTSISTNGTDIVFLAEQGLVKISNQGGTPSHISREVDHELQPLLAGSYNSSIYISSTWSPSLKQFIFMVMAQSTVNSPWEEVGTGNTSSAIAGWQDVGTLADDVWEDVGSTGSADAMRIKIWGWSPELSQGIDNIWMEYTFAITADDNVLGKFPTFLFHPSPSSDSGDPQQDKTMMGYWDGTQGRVCSIFRKDRNTDEGAAFTAELITGRIVPGNQDGSYKLFHGVGFQNSYSDPTSDSLGVLKYLIDFDDPQLRNYAPSLITISDTTDMKKFTTMLGRHVHLYLSDTSQSQSKILLGEFFIHYRERMRKEGR